MPLFSDILYASLPEVYRRYDEGDKPLKRFLSVFGPELDLLTALSVAFVDIMDPNTCPAVFLPYLAHKLGVDILPDVTESALRKLIVAAKFVWKRKGTLIGIRAYCQALTSWTITVTDVYKNVAITNSADYKTLSTADSTPWAGVAFTWDSADATANHILLTCDDVDVDPAVVATKEGILNQALPKLVPAGVPWVIAYAVH